MQAGSSIGRLTSIRRDVLRKVRQVGVFGAMSHALRRLAGAMRSGSMRVSPQADSFDTRYGTETAEIVSVGALDIADDHLDQSNRYEAIASEAFAGIVDVLRLEHERFSFVDIGCGKGRALLLASLYPFREVIGVEISPALVRAAEANIRKFKEPAQKCRNLRTLVQDGGAYEPPANDCVLFLNNPFGHAVMERLVATVERSLRDAPRKLYVIYLTPLQRGAWDRAERFSPLHDKGQVVIYESR